MDDLPFEFHENASLLIVGRLTLQNLDLLDFWKFNVIPYITNLKTINFQLSAVNKESWIGFGHLHALIHIDDLWSSHPNHLRINELQIDSKGLSNALPKARKLTTDSAIEVLRRFVIPKISGLDLKLTTAVDKYDQETASQMLEILRPARFFSHLKLIYFEECLDFLTYQVENGHVRRLELLGKWPIIAYKVLQTMASKKFVFIIVDHKAEVTLTLNFVKLLYDNWIKDKNSLEFVRGKILFPEDVFLSFHKETQVSLENSFREYWSWTHDNFCFYVTVDDHNSSIVSANNFVQV
ncbi:hypothetical protein L596_020616 [Steinernema carpocapsae]|uniref:Uncharacterized protein n=1 Tax=Steinernema carpocapsae TaxID=34508 RepID=A0A4U5MU92_STECR|nr:hypothetical protein L596_020616 [Steinernema carpocapsae]